MVCSMNWSSRAMTRERRMISGRVPTTVTTLSFISHLAAYGVRPIGVEHLTGPKPAYEQVAADVGHVVRPTGNRLDHARRATADGNVAGFVGQDVAEAESRLAVHDDKLLGFGVMIMAAARHPGICRKHRKLTGVVGPQHLGK